MRCSQACASQRASQLPTPQQPTEGASRQHAHKYTQVQAHTQAGIVPRACLGGVRCDNNRSSHGVRQLMTTTQHHHRTVLHNDTTAHKEAPLVASPHTHTAPRPAAARLPLCSPVQVKTCLHKDSGRLPIHISTDAKTETLLCISHAALPQHNDRQQLATGEARDTRGNQPSSSQKGGGGGHTHTGSYTHRRLLTTTSRTQSLIQLCCCCCCYSHQQQRHAGTRQDEPPGCAAKSLS